MSRFGETRRAGGPDNARPTTMVPDWLIDTPEGCVVTVRVIPRAGRTEIAGERAGALLARIGAAPVEGAANDALLQLLAKRLDIPRQRLRIVAGERGRSKRVVLGGLSAADVARRLDVADLRGGC